MMRLGTILLAAVALWPSVARAQTPDATLPSCGDQQVAPKTVTFACGDAGFLATDLTWSDWGAAQATGSGTAVVKDCDPDCASGGESEYPIVLVAAQLRDCAYGKPQYTVVTYSFPESSPFAPGSPEAEDPAVSFPCPERPHADPRIRAMHMRLRGHGPAGSRYYVTVSIRLRVCGARGRSSVVLNETLGGGGHIFASRTHWEHFRQRSRCEWRTFRWRLWQKFFGIGTYKVRATVWDRDDQVSNTLSRHVTTTD